MICDMWHGTCDMWHMTHGGGLTLSKNVSSLTRWTAQATPGLLNNTGNFWLNKLHSWAWILRDQWWDLYTKTLKHPLAHFSHLCPTESLRQRLILFGALSRCAKQSDKQKSVCYSDSVWQTKINLSLSASEHQKYWKKIQFLCGMWQKIWRRKK